MTGEFKFPFEKLEVWHLAVGFADYVRNIWILFHPTNI